MDDPKRRFWLYLISGVVVIAGAIVYLSIDGTTLDWLLLAGGVVLLYQAFKQYRELHKDDDKPAGPAAR